MSDQKPREIAARILDRATGGARLGRERARNLRFFALDSESSALVSSSRLGGSFIEDLVEKALGHNDLAPADRRLCQELVYGVIRWLATLDFLISRKTGGRTQKARLRTLLRLGLYQIFWLGRIPNHAAVHETVDLAKQAGFGPQSGFVNAVLRGYVREFESTKSLLKELKTEQPAIGYSHPAWLVERWEGRWGIEATARLMDWNNTPPKIFARVNTLLARPDQLLEQWRTENVEYDFVSRAWFDQNLVFELKEHPPLNHLRSFQQGWFYVQDPSTLLAVRILEPKPGESVLDLCAAPGGKLSYIAQLMREDGHLVAHDRSEERLQLIRENCERLGLKNVETANRVAFNTNRRLFDRILIDAPCSNTGVMRRRVDLRWRLRPDEILRLQAEQMKLLREAALILKKRGTIVYSTCSLEPEENQEVINRFLRERGEFQLEHERELLPFVDEVDGAYVARLTR